MFRSQRNPDITGSMQTLVLLAIACLVGAIAGWARKGARKPRVRLLVRPQKAPPPVLIPPGPTQRLIPSDSPKATRVRPTPTPAPRMTPVSTTRSGIVDYIAPFADSGEATDNARVDYLLESDESIESPDSPT
jgi:hypothetical protein